MSQWLNRSEDFAKHQLANSRNGVVGNSGNTIPATPRPTHNQPITIFASGAIEKRTLRFQTVGGGKPTPSVHEWSHSEPDNTVYAFLLPQ